jgi:cathepsin A (carboxypeptidase C)
VATEREAMAGLLFAVLAAAALPAAQAAIDADEVKALPGWSKALPSPWYSGYLSFGKKHLHYVFVNALEHSEDAPVVLWMNGGPGCSSMDALFYEHGPLLVSEDGAQLVENPYTWTKLANVLYLEAPVGVGYSYSEDPADMQKLTDDSTAADNLQALKEFFKGFPELKKNPFYVTGESYGGVYVPTLSLKIFQDASVDWNMKGFAVGNGVFDWKLMQQSHIPFLYGHGAISPRMMANLDKACQGDYVDTSEECQKLVSQVDAKTSELNFYDYYRDCYQSSDLKKLLTGPRLAKEPDLYQELIKAPRPPHPALQTLVGADVPCIDSVGGTTYLGKAEVRTALHIEPSLDAWEICSSKIGYQRNMQYSAPELYKVMKDKYKILVYNGDTDMACDYVADSWGVDMVNATVDSEMDWVPWTLRKGNGQQAAGFVTKYLTQPGMHFITVKGAGHMVPQWKPQEALEMLSRFLDGRNMATGASNARVIV